MPPKFTFHLTLNEAQLVVGALKKLPMESVESLVLNLDKQFIEQNTAMQPAAEPATNDNNTSDTATVSA